MIAKTTTGANINFKIIGIMNKNLSFNVAFSTFVNWYFCVNNANELTPDLLARYGFDNEYFGFDDLGNNGTKINNAEEFCDVLQSNYNDVARVEIVPDKMSDFAKITFKNGVSFCVECGEIDTLLKENERENVYTCTYKNFDIYGCNVFDRVLYRVAIFAKYPDYYTYFANLETLFAYIDKNPNGIK